MNCLCDLTKPKFVSVDTLRIDREGVESFPCDQCGSSMKYEERYNEYGYYSPVAICTNAECECEFEC